jgi:hypothetical protein
MNDINNISTSSNITPSEVCFKSGVLSSKHIPTSAFVNSNLHKLANKGAYGSKVLKKARTMAKAKELAVEPVVSDKSHREDQLVKRFLANVRILRNYKPRDNEQHLKRSISVAKAISEVYFFLNQNYFRDNNKEFDLYLAITDKNYAKGYMSNFSINDRVRNLYFKPRNIEIIYNTETFRVEAVFNNKEFVDLFYGSNVSHDTHSVLSHICQARAILESDYKALVLANDAVHNERDMQNICVAHIAKSIVNEPQLVVAQWILDKDVALTVEDFFYVYTTPHCMRDLVKGGIGAIDLNANPHKYDAGEHKRLRDASEMHIFDDRVTMHNGD